MTEQMKVNLQDAYETHTFFEPNHSVLEFVQPVLDEWINNVREKGSPFNFDHEKTPSIFQCGAFVAVCFSIENEIENKFCFFFSLHKEGVETGFHVKPIDFAMISEHSCRYRLCILRNAWQMGFHQAKNFSEASLLF
jgi:hypothetical protein